MTTLNDRRCECGGTLEPTNVFPVESLHDAAEKGQAWGADAVAFFGCRGCGEWFVLPAVKKPDNTWRGHGEGDA